MKPKIMIPKSKPPLPRTMKREANRVAVKKYRSKK